MFKTAVILVSLVVSTTAWATQPSEASVSELLDRTNADVQLRNAEAIMAQSIRSGFEKRLGGTGLSAKEEQALQAITGKVIEGFSQEINWSKLKPVLITIYQTTFTQEEVDLMLDLSKNAVGRSALSKLHAAIPEFSSAVSRRLRELTPHLLEIAERVAQEEKRK